MATKKRRAPTTFSKAPLGYHTDASNRSSDVPDADPAIPNIGAARRTPYEHAPFMIVYPAVMHKGGPFVLDLQFLMPLTNIGEAFRDAHLAILGPRPKVKTAIELSRRLRTGIVKYLLEAQLSAIELASFGSIPPLFEKWLNQSENNKARWKESTRASRYLYVKRLFEQLVADPRWNVSIPQRPRFKSCPWSGHQRKTHSETGKIVDDDLMTRIRLSCIKEIIKTIQRRSEIQRIIEEYEIESNSKKGDGFHFFARNREYEKIVIFIHKAILKNPGFSHDDFPNEFTYTLSKHNTNFSEITDLLIPSARILVPFVILMALGLTYNSETIRDVLISDFRIDREIASHLVYFGDKNDFVENERPDIFVNAFKGRSGKRQPVYVPIDDEPDNPYFIYSFITQWTAEIRKRAYIGVSDKLFIFRGNARSTDGVSSFTGLNSTQNASVWGYQLKRFREEHELEYFNLRMMRPTGLDTTYVAFGGDIRYPAIQGNHAFSQTTSRYYQSDAEIERQYERLGNVHNQRERWRRTNGTIDPRDHPESFDLDCATPGWTCASPYDSPITPKGELCRGYGRCPDCPLGSVDLNSPLSCAYTFGLLEAIDRAQLSLDPMTWLNRWQPVKQQLLEKWLPSFSSRAVERAKEIDIPPMPRPE